MTITKLLKLLPNARFDHGPPKFLFSYALEKNQSNHSDALAIRGTLPNLRPNSMSYTVLRLGALRTPFPPLSSKPLFPGWRISCIRAKPNCFLISHRNQSAQQRTPALLITVACPSGQSSCSVHTSAVVWDRSVLSRRRRFRRSVFDVESVGACH